MGLDKLATGCQHKAITACNRQQRSRDNERGNKVCEGVCVCVHVSERERPRERQKEGER